MARAPKTSILERALEAASEYLKTDAKQQDVGKLAGGIKQPSVSLWKNAAPSMETAIVFCENTGVCVEWLLTGRGPKYPGDAATASDPYLAKIIKMWPDMTPSAKKAAWGQVWFVRTTQVTKPVRQEEFDAELAELSARAIPGHTPPSKKPS